MLDLQISICYNIKYNIYQKETALKMVKSMFQIKMGRRAVSARQREAGGVSRPAADGRLGSSVHLIIYIF